MLIVKSRKVLLALAVGCFVCLLFSIGYLHDFRLSSLNSSPLLRLNSSESTEKSDFRRVSDRKVPLLNHKHKQCTCENKTSSKDQLNTNLSTADVAVATFPPYHHVPVCIPRIIHQTWKTGNLPPLAVRNVNSWKYLNQEYEHRLYTDDDISSYVERRHPDLQHVWQRMKPIHRADMFRYLILYDVGGYYADIDVTLNIPLNDWPLKHSTYDAAGIIVGFEVIVGDRPDWQKWFARKHQMCQWTMAAVPGHAILRQTIDKIKHIFTTYLEHELKTTSAVKLTGPAIWSDSITGVLRGKYHVTLGSLPFSNERLRDNYILIGDILLMPMRSFSVGSGGYMPSPSFEITDQLVTHGFQGSWKRMPNPLYGDQKWSEAHLLNTTLHTCLQASNGSTSFTSEEEGKSYHNFYQCTIVKFEPSTGVKGKVCGLRLSNSDENLLDCLFDRNDETQWSAVFPSPSTVQEETVNVTVVLNPKLYIQLQQYAIRSGRHFPSRDPTNWDVYCINHMETTVLIHTVREHIFEWRMQAQDFRPTETVSCHTFIFLFLNAQPRKSHFLELTEISITHFAFANPVEKECIEVDFGKLCMCCVFDFDGVLKVLDSNPSTVWQYSWPSNSLAELQPQLWFQFSSSKNVVTGYSMTVGDNTANHDPSSWRILGKRHQQTNWEVLDHQEKVSFQHRNSAKTFQFLPEKVNKYEELKWELISVKNASEVRSTHQQQIYIEIADFTWHYQDQGSNDK